MGNKLGHAKSFKDLEVYKLSRELAKNIFELTLDFPKEERYALTDQIRRSSRSIGAQIAESWGKRKYEKHFVLKLTGKMLNSMIEKSSLFCKNINVKVSI